MLIKTITIQKSRTIETTELLGRDRFRKLNIGLEANLDTEDELNNTNMCYDILSDKIDELMEIEIQKLNNLVRNKKS